MIRIFAAFTFLTVFISTASVYNLKETTEELEKRKDAISGEILGDRQAIKVLRAEMAYLSRPERLERLSRRPLDLEQTEIAQLDTGLSGIAVRENTQLASLHIDNFRYKQMLPRQKPDPTKVVRVSHTDVNQRADLDVVSVTEGQANNNDSENRVTVQEKTQETMSLYERILAKIGN